ncbi:MULTISPECIES: ATP-grasp domain-containing protein [Gammaproteobacteria]|uniref:ATP-grasp domain-containing protein n=2 Tax=Vreelandella TaxID=3137766 RepID=A0A7Z0LWJ0_9GAMM|nr:MULTISPECIES: ATP-grasp domain-containing protein [Halomonas]NYS79899.1 ATP-grasp domain-containing protein [Halomonas glaciei]|tara:strand:+ start:610 stop:1929 length:1320 start_codon:yes stop_codon:yes gene_type:complete
MAIQSERRNVFVLGFDERHGADVQKIPDSDQFTFYPLLRSEELVHQKHYAIEEMLAKARGILRDFDGSIDAIVCHWDFPATPIAAVLCEELGLPGPSLEAVLKCSHKYWSRLEQQKTAPEHTPRFCAVDPFDDDPLEKVSLDYPFWIKPIKGYGSMLGFRINNAHDFEHAIGIIREKISRIGDSFNTILSWITLPEEVRGITGNHLIAEECISGLEIAPEGSVQHGVYRAHGMIDMVRDHNHKSFLRYEYPSKSPRNIQQRAIDLAEKILKKIGFDNGCFNMEFFWNQDTDDLWIIEINPRISQSHSYQFEMVDGMSNHEIAIHVALGDQPHFEHGQGPYKHAAKCLLRHYSQDDAVATRVPTERDLLKIKSAQPDTDVVITLKKGGCLSELLDQDAYSYLLAEVYVAGNTVHEMLDKYHQVVEMLPFEYRPLAGEKQA